MEDENQDDVKLSIQLFDKTSNYFKRAVSLQIDDSFICLDKGNKIIKFQNQCEIEDNRFLFCPSFDEEFNIYIDNLISHNNIYQNEAIVNELDNKLWYIIPSNKEENKNKNYCYLSEGDIIKFGNSKFIVNKIKIENNKTNNNNDENNDNNEDIKPFINHIIPRAKNCKFCQSYYFPICECDEAIYFSCFRKVNNGKVEIKNNSKNTVTKYELNNFLCQECMCHYSFSYLINIKSPIEKIVPLYSFDFNEPNDDYLILESIGNRNKIVYVINLNKGDIKIGNIKNKENDIGIDDNSIDDVFAVIKLEEKTGKIKLENLCEDGFNMGILVQKEILIENDKIYCFKVGNDVFKLNSIYYPDSDD